tara:strand:+ start:615 stop:926 length:312 start_codon:yes stop_codon:yes gene_type:complete
LTQIKKKSKSILNKIGKLISLFIFLNFFISYKSFAQESYKYNEIEIDKTFNLEEEDNIDFPTNPFEIVDKIRRANSMNDATNPSDAIDEAIKSFDMIKVDKEI